MQVTRDAAIESEIAIARKNELNTVVAQMDGLSSSMNNVASVATINGKLYVVVYPHNRVLLVSNFYANNIALLSYNL